MTEQEEILERIPGILYIGEAWRDEKGQFHAQDWSFEAGFSFSPDELIEIAKKFRETGHYCIQ